MNAVRPLQTAHQSTPPGEPLVEVTDLQVRFRSRRSRTWIRAVDGVSFSIQRGESLGLVGESGCGKSTTGRATLQLLKPDQGSVRYGGRELIGLRGRQLRAARRHMQMVFQDPYSSLDPRMKVGAAIREPLISHRIARGAAARERTAELLSLVGLAADAADRYPHEFSGGQRQRIAIARALAVGPDFLICDEPFSALDVSVQAQIVDLFGDLQDSLHLTYVFIAHDLAVIRHVSHRIAVMYLGQFVEILAREDLMTNALHPYTQSLISAVPRASPVVERSRERIILRGEIPSAANPPAGCRFHTRCPFADERCRVEAPLPEDIGGGHIVACHHWANLSASARKVRAASSRQVKP